MAAVTVLSGQNLKKLQAFLEQDAREYSDDYNDLASDPYSKIFAWAQDPEHGGLPERSARGFADWISGAWNDWVEEPVKVKDLLDGAVTEWCGGRTF